MNPLPSQLGKYQIIEKIGEGGFGAVYKAKDTTLERIVALKVLKQVLLADPVFIERFRREAKAAAALEHPHIVTIHEVGEEQGMHYLAMRYLSGESLDKLIAREGALPIERALTTARQIADALDYAHARGMIHRDVKPSNIIIGENESATLTDFGLVRSIEGSVLTSSMQMVGTVEYMAPEQLDTERASEVGPCTDLYALGIVVYQMLTGRVPFTGSTSAVIAAQLFKEPTRPTEYRKDLPVGTDAALLKMLAKQSRERYASGNTFVQALQGSTPEPKVTDEDTLVARFSPVQVFFRKPMKRLPLGWSAMYEGVLLIYRSRLRFLAEGFALNIPHAAVLAVDRQTITRGARVGAIRVDFEQAGQLQRFWFSRGIPTIIGGTTQETHELGSVLEEWFTRGEPQSKSVRTRVKPESQVPEVNEPVLECLTPVQFFSDSPPKNRGPITLSWSEVYDHEGVLWVYPSQLIFTHGDFTQAIPRAEIRSITLQVTTRQGWGFGAVRIDFTHAGQAQFCWLTRIKGAAAYLTLTNRETREMNDLLLRWFRERAPVAQARELKLHTAAVRSVAFSPDSALLVSGSDDRSARIWRVADGVPVRELRAPPIHLTGYVYGVAFSPDGNYVATASNDNLVRLWQVSDGSLVSELRGHSASIWSVAFSPDGTLLASGSVDRTIRLWQVKSGNCILELKGHGDIVYQVAFNRDGTLLASASEDKTVCVWQVNQGILSRTYGHPGAVRSISFNPTGTLLASASSDKTIRIWQMNDGALLNELRGHSKSVTSVAFSPDGNLLASASMDQTAQLWQVGDGAWFRTLTGHTNCVSGVAYSPDGIWLATASDDGIIRLWEMSRILKPDSA